MSNIQSQKPHAGGKDFSKGKVSANIMAQALPLILAQLVQLLYNVVDRIYIGHLQGADSLALTGIGLAFPLTTLIAAFTFLFGFRLREGREMMRGRSGYLEILSRCCSQAHLSYLFCAMLFEDLCCTCSGQVMHRMCMRMSISEYTFLERRSQCLPRV